MTNLTIDTLKLSDRLESAGFDRKQVEAVVRAIAEAQDQLVTQQALDLSLAPIRADLTILKWGLGLVLAGIAAQIFKTFFS